MKINAGKIVMSAWTVLYMHDSYAEFAKTSTKQQVVLIDKAWALNWLKPYHQMIKYGMESGFIIEWLHRRTQQLAASKKINLSIIGFDTSKSASGVGLSHNTVKCYKFTDQPSDCEEGWQTSRL